MADKDTNVPNKNDFISREDAEQFICEACERPGCPRLWGNDCEIICRLNKITAADVRPVVRAFWVGKMEGVGICSNCKRLDHIDPLATHCRYCGADMREPQMLKNAIQNADANVITPAT